MLMWEVEVTETFVDWWETLSVDQQESVADRVDLLAAQGPDLGRPVVDRISGSRHHHMKEHRASKGGALQVLFAFDPRRQVILLVGGDRAASGTRGTSGQFPPPMTCTTSTSTSCGTRV